MLLTIRHGRHAIHEVVPVIHGMDIHILYQDVFYNTDGFLSKDAPPAQRRLLASLKTASMLEGV